MWVSLWDRDNYAQCYWLTQIISGPLIGGHSSLSKYNQTDPGSQEVSVSAQLAGTSVQLSLKNFFVYNRSVQKRINILKCHSWWSPLWKLYAEKALEIDYDYEETTGRLKKNGDKIWSDVFHSSLRSIRFQDKLSISLENIGRNGHFEYN